MKFNYIKSIIPVTLFAAMITITSCTDELNISPIDPSVNLEFVQDEVFAKLYATLGLTGQKGADGNGDVSGIDEGTSAFYRLIFTVNEYPSDEAICSWNDAGIPELNFMGWGSSHGQVEGLYGRLNYNVTLCNHFLDKTAGLTDENTLKQRAEARFLRALNYSYLMDIFGNVPFSETVSDELPKQIKRADLFLYLEEELLALDLENNMYEARQAPFGRVDKVAVWFLLSRIYLNAEVYTGTARWADAAKYAKMVMDSSYDLCPTYAHLFMGDNDKNENAKKEIILPIRQDGIKTRSWGGSLYVIAATRTNGMTPWGSSEGWGGVRARKTLVDKFFPNGGVPLDGVETDMVTAAKDDRALFFAGGERTVEIAKVSVFKEGLSVAKWSNLRSDGGLPSDPKFTDTDIPFFRLGEAYLTYAEALLRIGGSGASEALTVVNELRGRSHATPLGAVSLNNILDERARELYFEGQRRTDLVRYGFFTSNQYLWDWKGGQASGTSVSSTFNIYPIPVSDVIANENLVQNPGY